MTIRKRGKKSYYLEKMFKGKRYSLTLDYKPTKAEAEKIMWDLIENDAHNLGNDTFEAKATAYIDSKSKVLSASTIRGYRSILRSMPYEFKNARLNAITGERVQLFLNDLTRRKLSPKTVRNNSGFISAVMKSANPNWNSNARLPQPKVEQFYVPEKEDVKRILAAAKDSRFEIVLWLGVFSLRRSEILALEKSDLKDNTITVNKALVPDENDKYVLKATKTAESTRDVAVTPYVADLIRKLPDGRIYNGHPNSILNYLHKTQDKLGIPRFSFHFLRHFFASTARESMGDVYVESMGGWKKGSNVMKKVYDYAQKKELDKAKADFARRLDDLLSS